MGITSFFKDRDKIALLLVGVFAVLIQVQITVFRTEEYIGLRLNAADFVLPFLGMGILVSLFRGRSVLPEWRGLFGYWCIGVLSAIFVIGCLVGYVFNGHLSEWAVYNKLTGWFVLMAYLGAGAWFVRNSDAKTVSTFMGVFLAFFALTCFYDLVRDYIYWEMESLVFGYPGRNLDGFMGNRNAFGYLALISAIFMTVFVLSENKLSKAQKIIHYGFWFLSTTCLLQIASRALWVAMALVIGMLLWRYRMKFVRYALPAILIALLVVPLIFPKSAEQMRTPLLSGAALIDSDRYDQAYSHLFGAAYDQPRLILLGDGMEIAQNHPFTGAGLGSILEKQKEKYGEIVSVLDNTSLWILAEMGPLGLFCFTWVFLIMLGALYRKREETDIYDRLRMAAFYMLMAFGIYSLFHEILYTRFMWFVLGMALVVPKARLGERDRGEPEGSLETGQS